MTRDACLVAGISALGGLGDVDEDSCRGDLAAIRGLCEGGKLTEAEEQRCADVHRLLAQDADHPAMDIKGITRFMRQDKANSFLLPLPEAVQESQGREGVATGRAVAIYPHLLAMANHSCCKFPTTSAIRHHRKIQVG